MWKSAATKATHSWRMLASSSSRALRRGISTANSIPTKQDFAQVKALLLRSVKQHYDQIAALNPPPKVNPPSPFSVVRGSLESYGPVLKREYDRGEEISVSVMRLINYIPGGGEDEDDDKINQLFLKVKMTKPDQSNALHFLCALYPDAMGIEGVQMRPKDLEEDEDSDDYRFPKYSGPRTFQDLDEKMRDALHGYVEERGVNESLFPFLQAWLYVRDHRKLLKWFKSLGTVISEPKYDSDED